MSELERLSNLLDQCDLQTAAQVQCKLSSCKKRLKEGKPVDRTLSQLAPLIEAAKDSVELRKQSVGQVTLAELPVSERASEIAKAIRDHQVVVVAGETGSGKTTQLPKICLQEGFGVKGLIGHTQPRRLAARTVAQRISEELHSPLGVKVGYQVRFTEQVGDASLIKLMTDGILLSETQRDPLLLKYEVIIVDEAHERSLNIDFLLGYLRRILDKRSDLKLIITSATIDLERFSKHFNDAPIIEVSGRTYPVDMLYRPLVREHVDDKVTLPQEQGVLEAIDEIVQLHRGKPVQAPRDILVFLSGEREIRETAEHLRKAQLRNTLVMPLYARLSVAEQNKIFKPDGISATRVILATNVAETSVTVPGIGYVIDAGQARISRYSYRSKVQRLPVEAISQASAAQRAGRCGRIAPGVCIRLYSEEDFESRPEFTDAEIRRTNLGSVILQMLNLKLGDIAQFPFIDPPDQRFINDGFNLLQELCAVNGRREMTPLGRQMAKLPVDPRIARMIIEAQTQGALREVLVIASALSVQDPKERPADKQQAADQCHALYKDKDSDFIGFINLWNSYEEQRQSLSNNQLRKYAQKHFLSFMRMREWRDVHRQLHLACKALDYRENTGEASYESVHKSLLAGLLSQIGFKQENREFLGARNRRFYIFPASTQYKKPAQWVVASELVETSKLYARNVAKIEPQWIEALAPHLVKKHYHEARWQKKRSQVVADEQVSLYGLFIVPKRPVHYGPINPEEAQEIFIRSALVEGLYVTKAPFFKQNRALLDEVEALEVKTRRRDLLVDEETLYQFYVEKISAHSDGFITNGIGFEKWRKRVESQHPTILVLTEKDVLQRCAEHINDADYPDQLHWKGVNLGLEYNFEPQNKDDGVSINLPVALVKQFPAERLQWLVPGLLRDRCIALLKGLPKQRRKHFVPIPNVVDGFLESASFAQGDLLEQLCRHLLRLRGVKLSPQE
ncbi:MAG: ATP-dependent RNA helicase HrpA, partial [Pseudomonadales bacterium]